MAQITPKDFPRIMAELSSRIRRLEIQGNRGVVKTGPASERPATPTVLKGTTTSYYANDTKVFSIWNTDILAWDEVTLS